MTEQERKNPIKRRIVRDIIYILQLNRSVFTNSYSWADPEGGGVSDPHPLQNHKNIGFLSKTGPDRLKNHKATKQAVNDGPSSARQQNAISMAFCRRADAWHTFSGIWPSLSHYLKKRKKKLSELDPLWQNFLTPRMMLQNMRIP